MKYVIVSLNCVEVPIIFSDAIRHDTFKHLKLVSAGEISLYGSDEPLPNACCCENAIRVCAYGGSVSLKMPSRPEDAKLIADELMRHYN